MHAQLCPTLCDPMGCSPPGSSVHGISQARMLEWGAISFSRGSCVSCIVRWTLDHCATWEGIREEAKTSHLLLFLASPPNLSSPGLSATRALTQGEGQPPAHGHASPRHDPQRTKGPNKAVCFIQEHEPHYGHQERDPNTERPPM